MHWKWFLSVLTISHIASADPANILLIVSDDHHYTSLGCLGHPVIQTPHLDQLAKDGVIFTHCFSPNPICTPSRACILTGQDSWTNGSTFFGKAIHETSPRWPRLLAENGYDVFYTGKWHNNGIPADHGFTAGNDIWVGGLYDHRDLQLVQHGETRKQRKRKEKPVFASTLFADAAIGFLERRDARKPFAIFLSFTAPHDPWLPPGPYDTMYAAKDMPLPENFMSRPPYKIQDSFPCLRDQRQLGWPRYPWMVRSGLTQYYGMISQMDEQIGRVLAVLEERNLANDTLVLFVGDHGYSMGSHGFVGKQTMNEEGIRTPLILRYPRIKRSEPSVSKLVSLIDLFPTIAESAGCRIPETVEGRSLLGLYQGKDTTWRSSVFSAFHSPDRHHMSTRCIRTERYKYIQHLLTNEEELFDLRADPFEMRNIIDQPDVAEQRKKLNAELMQWRSSSQEK